MITQLPGVFVLGISSIMVYICILINAKRGLLFYTLHKIQERVNVLLGETPCHHVKLNVTSALRPTVSPHPARQTKNCKSDFYGHFRFH